MARLDYTDWDLTAIRALVEDVNGPVMQYIAADAAKCYDQARKNVGVTQPANAYEETHSHYGRRPGTLRDSMMVFMAPPPDGKVKYAWWVGSNDKIALVHHEGGDAHPIKPVNAPRLVFWWRRRGRLVSMLSVNHPGNPPNRFLTKCFFQPLGHRYSYKTFHHT